MSALKFVFFLLFLSVLSSSLFSASVIGFDVNPTNNESITTSLGNNSYFLVPVSNNVINDFTDRQHTNKKYFRIGKKIFRNPFYKSPNKFLKDKVSTVCIILLTGPLGGHRLYLGTKPIVPVVYAVTLGGGIGILPVIDMFVVIFTKDLNRYIDNDKIIMWIE